MKVIPETNVPCTLRFLFARYKLKVRNIHVEFRHIFDENLHAVILNHGLSSDGLILIDILMHFL
jgi:hypothetical protein